MYVLAACVPLLGAVGLAFSAYRYKWVVEQDPGNDLMQGIGARIQRGAMAFLKAEYTVLLGFLVVVGGLRQDCADFPIPVEPHFPGLVACEILLVECLQGELPGECSVSLRHQELDSL